MHVIKQQLIKCYSICDHASRRALYFRPFILQNVFLLLLLFARSVVLQVVIWLLLSLPMRVGGSLLRVVVWLLADMSWYSMR